MRVTGDQHWGDSAIMEGERSMLQTQEGALADAAQSAAPAWVLRQQAKLSAPVSACKIIILSSLVSGYYSALLHTTAGSLSMPLQSPH